MVFRKGKNERTLGTFMCIGVIKMSFSFILNKEIHALRGLLNTKKCQLQLQGARGALPPVPRDIFAPLTFYSGAALVIREYKTVQWTAGKFMTIYFGINSNKCMQYTLQLRAQSQKVPNAFFGKNKILVLK